jgi:hypothetical protein
MHPVSVSFVPFSGATGVAGAVAAAARRESALVQAAVAEASARGRGGSGPAGAGGRRRHRVDRGPGGAATGAVAALRGIGTALAPGGARPESAPAAVPSLRRPACGGPG